MTDDQNKTNSPESSEPIKDDLVAYLDGELEGEASHQLERRLASDPKLRGELVLLERTWDLLDGLGRSELDETFTRSTIEMVAIKVEDDLRKQEEEQPARARRRLRMGAGWLATAALAGFVAVWLLWPNEKLLDDLPVLERLDQYRQIDEVDFLRELQQSGLFPAEGTDDT